MFGFNSADPFGRELGGGGFMYIDVMKDSNGKDYVLLFVVKTFLRDIKILCFVFTMNKALTLARGNLPTSFLTQHSHSV